MFKTLDEVQSWCSHQATITAIDEAIAMIDTAYHKNMWEIELDTSDDSPVECYEVWYMDFSPFENPWCLRKTFSTYDEASKFVFDELKTWSSTPQHEINEFAHYLIYALSRTDQRAREKSVERHNAMIKRQCQEVQQCEKELQSVLSGLYIILKSKFPKNPKRNVLNQSKIPKRNDCQSCKHTTIRIN